MNRSRARAIRRKYQKKDKGNGPKGMDPVSSGRCCHRLRGSGRNQGKRAGGQRHSGEYRDTGQHADARGFGDGIPERCAGRNLKSVRTYHGTGRVQDQETYRWDMRIRNGEESVSLEDLAGPQLEEILETIEHGDKDKPQSYELDYGRMEQAFAQQAAELAQGWDRGAVDSQMESL